MRRPLFSNYTGEKLYSAVTSLLGDQPLFERLEYAARDLTLLKADDFPDPHTVQMWRELCDDLTWCPAQYAGEGTIRATTRCLLDYDADELAQKILRLFLELEFTIRGVNHV
jgi:hypothetical protein